MKLGVKIRNSCELLEQYCKNTRGVTYQKNLLKQGKFRFIGGKEISRYGVRGYKGYCNNVSELKNNAFIKDNSLLLQNIIAHIQNPTPHIKIIAMLPESKDFFLLDTINQLVFVGQDSRLMWAIFNSTLINWYVYKFIYANAIRTMHFDSPVSDRIPIPKIDSTNKALSDEIISLVEQILDSKAKDPTTDTKELESKIDFLVYKLYNLAKDEIKIIEGK